MNRFYISIFLVALITSFCIYSQIKVQQITTEIVSLIDTAIESSNREDYEFLPYQINQLKTNWEERELVLVHFVRHTDIDDISKAISRLPALSMQDDNILIESELEYLLWLVKHIQESEKPTFHNLI